jgi:hypothetical protein
MSIPFALSALISASNAESGAPPLYRPVLSDITNHLRTTLYFAHPYCWEERVTSENHNGIIRRFLPKGTNFSLISDKGARNYRIEIAISKHVKVDYHFEVGFNEITGYPITSKEVKDNILVKERQAVKAGDPIGIIPYYEDGSHVHFSIHDEKYGGETPDMPSPLTYFESSVAEKLEAMNVLW